MRLVSLFRSSLSAQVYQQELRGDVDKRALSLKERLKFRNLLRRPKSEDYFLRERLINSREKITDKHEFQRFDFCLLYVY